MNKPGKGFSFRKSMRGFNKDDVIQYISDENKRFNDEKTALEEKLGEANWQIGDLLNKLKEQKDYYDKLLKEKEVETDAALSEANKAKADLADAEERAAKAGEENIRLHALVNGCEEQLCQYADTIAKLEAAVSMGTVDKNEYDKIRDENEYIRNKYKALEGEFQSLLSKVRSMESAPAVYSTPRESQEDPFQRGSYTAIKEGSATTDPFNPKKHTRSSNTVTSSNDTQEISQKAIKTILAVNDNVKQYMTDCVGEFDSYSRDISSGLTKLADDISARCKTLEEKIRAHKETVSENIDDVYSGFNSGN